MTLRSTVGGARTEVGVRELHDHLSRYVQEVQDGAEVIVTMRGRPVARLSAIDADEVDPLADLRARGIIKEPKQARTAVEDFPPPIKVRGSVSDLVSELRNSDLVPDVGD